MLSGLFILLACQLVGELLRLALDLPLPAPVIGMVVLTAALALRSGRGATAEPGALDRVAGFLLEHMGLLFVPAGVGIIAQLDLLRAEWLPIVAAVLGSTLLSLGLTALVLYHLTRPKQSRSASLAEGVRS
jgi:holin-like protein